MNASMQVALELLPAGDWSAEPADVVTLDYDQRHRRRIAMTGNHGTSFILDLSETTLLRDGDGLLLQNGDIILVRASDEPLVEISAPDSTTLTRIAWHLGNRHLPTAIGSDTFLIRRDHVIEAMIEGLGGSVRPVETAFNPEGGAYEGHHHHHNE